MAQDIFLKLSGIPGEARDAHRKDEIEVISWTWRISQESTMHSGAGGGTGKATVGDLIVDHYVDRSSPILLKHSLTGKHVDTATLVVRKAGGTPLEYLRLTMDDVIVTGVKPVVTQTMRRARETISLAFARVKQEYVVQTPQGHAGGTVSASFDIQQNREY